ncbi:MAG TPA: NADH-quinone oxidoreductase subunit J [Bacteroidota bacterium]
MTLEAILFYVLSVVAIGSALLVVTRRSPVISALYLIVNFFCLAGLYLTLHAQFIAVIQIIVYAGAIMVLFVFVIMLLNLGDERRLRDGMSYKKVVAVGLAAGLLTELIYVVATSWDLLPPSAFHQTVEIGTVEYIGTQLFTGYLFPFEVTSILLLVAIVGAIVLAKRKF